MNNLLTAVQVENFRQLLNNYQPNEAVLEQFQTSNFGVIAGPTGAGKDTLRNALLALEPEIYVRILSTTTRPKRAGEKEEVDYCFRSADLVKAGLERREYFQTALVHDQQVACMHIDEVRKLHAGQIGLSILIVQTEAELKLLKPDIKTIFLIPPSLEVLHERMQAERMLNQDEVARRLQAAKKELKIALQRTDYFCLVSDDLSKLVGRADSFLHGKPKDDAADRNARRVMQNVLGEL